MVEPESTSALKNRILSLLNNKEAYGFKRYKEEKSWDKAIDRLIECYNSLEGES